MMENKKEPKKLKTIKTMPFCFKRGTIDGPGRSTCDRGKGSEGGLALALSVQ